MIQLLGSSHLDAKLHASIDSEPPLATHVALIALSIDKGLVCGSGEVVDTGIEYLEDVLVADAARKFAFSLEPVPSAGLTPKKVVTHMATSLLVVL